MSRHEIQILRAAAMGQAAVAAKTRLESYGREIIRNPVRRAVIRHDAPSTRRRTPSRRRSEDTIHDRSGRLPNSINLPVDSLYPLLDPRTRG